MISQRIRGLIARQLTLLVLSIVGAAGCSYGVDVIRYATEEKYYSGDDTLSRLQTAALVGFKVRYDQAPASADARAPVLALLGARVRTDRDYLATSVESCEKNLLLSNAAGADLFSQILSGVFCNLGPGKSPNEL